MSTPKSQDLIKSNDELSQIVEQQKAQGRTVIFTNGVFDFVHVGHLSYLEKAKELGDILIVAINSDASVKRIKGPERPINSEFDRARILAGLKCVDYVTIFDEDTSIKILEKLKPSIHTKGGDYDPEKMIETPAVRAFGGKVVIIPLEEGYSNSNQFEKIKEAEKPSDFKRPEWLAGAKK